MGIPRTGRPGDLRVPLDVASSPMKHSFLTGALVGASAVAGAVWAHFHRARPGYIEGVIESRHGDIVTLRIRETEDWSPEQGQPVYAFPNPNADIVNMEDDGVEPNGTYLASGGGGNS